MVERNTIRIRTLYPADPAGIVPGGIDTFIRGLIKWAPEDVEFSLVGMTTDPRARPVGRWVQCDLGRRQFDMFPVLQVTDPARRQRVPLSLRFAVAALRYQRTYGRNFDVYEFHRVESAMPYLLDRRPKNVFLHTDFSVIRSSTNTDIAWRRFPAGYFAIEAIAMRKMSSAFSVRQDTITGLRKRYPWLAPRIHYTPTWVDTEIFKPSTNGERRRIRAETEQALALDPAAFRIVTVGRLDSSKDPDLLLSAVAAMVAAGAPVELLYIGDGVLRQHLENRVAAESLASHVRFLGLRSPVEIAKLLQAADCFALSSAYEGMPMAMLEALASGLPVVSTPVGEVPAVVRAGLNGCVASGRSAHELAASLDHVRIHQAEFPVAQCAASIERYTPAHVLRPIYENYRRLALPSRAEAGCA